MNVVLVDASPVYFQKLVKWKSSSQWTTSITMINCYPGFGAPVILPRTSLDVWTSSWQKRIGNISKTPIMHNTLPELLAVFMGITSFETISHLDLLIMIPKWRFIQVESNKNHLKQTQNHMFFDESADLRLLLVPITSVLCSFARLWEGSGGFTCSWRPNRQGVVITWTAIWYVCLAATCWCTYYLANLCVVNLNHIWYVLNLFGQLVDTLLSCKWTW